MGQSKMKGMQYGHSFMILRLLVFDRTFELTFFGYQLKVSKAQRYYARSPVQVPNLQTTKCFINGKLKVIKNRCANNSIKICPPPIHQICTSSLESKKSFIFPKTAPFGWQMSLSLWSKSQRARGYKCITPFNITCYHFLFRYNGIAWQNGQFSVDFRPLVPTDEEKKL